MTAFPWDQPPKPARFNVGDEIYSDVDRGKVVEVDVIGNYIRVVWDDGDGGMITYPMDATYLEDKPPERMPWEK